MSDTQWTRYYVFKKDTEKTPFESCGTVHAPDAELALQNARDVFVRRPNCLELWAVPAHQVYTWSGDEVGALLESSMGFEDEGEVYHVFLKERRKTQHLLAGSVRGVTPEHALRAALKAFFSAEIGVWRLVPERAVLRSERSEQPSWFGPAYDKLYRQPNFYHTDSLMREIRRRRGESKPDED